VIRRLVVVLPVLVLATACGAGTVDKDDVAKAAEDALEQQVGQRPDVSCPEDLEGEVGTLTADGVDGTYGVTVTVTKVEGDQASFDFQVDSEPQG
jgi:hypothetical protein